MGKKRKLRKQMRKRELGDAPALVICVGKDCAPRELSRALRDDVRAYAADKPVRIEAVGCLHVCKKGPIVATFPKITFHKRVDAECAHGLVDALSARGSHA